MRLAALGILHETNTFATPKTDDRAFLESTLGGAPGIMRGTEVWDHNAGTRSPMGGFHLADSEPGVDVVPIGYATTHPAGPLPRSTFDGISARQLADLAAAGPFDGILLSQHGAMVAEDFPDADAEFIRRVREAVGPRVPIGVNMDTHGNVSPAQVHGADVTVLWRTNPHVDCADRALLTAQLIARTVRGEIEPVQAIVNPPVVVNILRQNTSDQPMRALLDRSLEIQKANPALLDMSIGEGFPYADVPNMGMAFIALANRDRGAAEAAAMQMAREAWERRADLDTTAPTVTEAVAHAYAAPVGPIVLLDVGDNIGGGSTGDSTFILEELLRRAQGDYLITVNDAGSVREAVSAGVGHDVELNVGGKVDHQHGTPQRVRGRVRTISDGHFTATGTVHGGWTAFDAGVTAVIQTPDGGMIVLTSGPLPTMALDQHYSIGLHPESFKVVIAKGVQSPKPAYGPIAKEMLYVDTPGIATANLHRLTHHTRRRPMFPFETDATF